MTDVSNEGTAFSTADLPQVEVYTAERIAEFLLNNAVSKRDYQAAVDEARNLGIDPAEIAHDRISSET